MIAEHESIQHLDDLLLRRSRAGLLLKEGGLDREFIGKVKEICQQELKWSDERWQAEYERYSRLLNAYYRLPTA